MASCFFFRLNVFMEIIGGSTGIMGIAVTLMGHFWSTDHCSNFVLLLLSSHTRLVPSTSAADANVQIQLA